MRFGESLGGCLRVVACEAVEPYPAKYSYRPCRGLSVPCVRIRRHSRGIRCLCSWRSLLAQVLAALSVPLTRYSEVAMLAGVTADLYWHVVLDRTASLVGVWSYLGSHRWQYQHGGDGDGKQICCGTWQLPRSMTRPQRPRWGRQRGSGGG